MRIHKVFFEGGPWDGQWKEIRGDPWKLYAAEQPGIDVAPFPPRDPTSPLIRKTHVYVRCHDGSYLYEGIQ